MASPRAARASPRAHLSDIPLGASLEANETVVAWVKYTPVDELPDAGALTVQSSDPLRPSASITLSGTAHPTPTTLDEFVRTATSTTDILWVIDPSSTMSLARDALRDNAAAFVDALTDLGLDYHLAVTTTNLADSGAFQGLVPIVDPGTPDPAGAFADNLDLNASWSPRRGFDGAYLALSSPNIDPGGPNASFLRTEAALRIVFVSNRNDHSSLLSNGNVSAYLAYWSGLKPYPDQLITSDITGGLTGCNGLDGDAGTGSLYVAATTLTGGLSSLVCDTDWPTTLAALAALAPQDPSSFRLSAGARTPTIEVRRSLDGVTFTPTLTGWEHDGALSVVRFYGPNQPVEGERIEIEYERLDTCWP